MLDALVESRRQRVRLGRGTAVSVAVHVLVIGLLVHASEPHRLEARPTPAASANAIIYIQRTTEPARTGGPSGAPRPVKGPPAVPRPLRLEIPTGLVAPMSDTLSRPTIGGDDFTRPSANAVSAGGGDGPPGNGLYGNGAAEIPAAMRPGNPRPPYPAMLRAAGITGRVRVQFVVNGNGRLEDGSVRIVSSSHALFTAAVLATLPRLRFRPAMVGGHPARVLVEQVFAFDLTR